LDGAARAGFGDSDLIISALSVVFHVRHGDAGAIVGFADFGRFATVVGAPTKTAILDLVLLMVLTA